MTKKINQKEGTAVMKSKILFIIFIALGSLLLTTLNLQAQPAKPSPSPASKEDGKTMLGGYELTTSVEVGVRGLDVNGNHEKFQSDFNYRPGLRIFDSSFLLEDKEGKQGVFDSLLVTSSGWGGDPSGYLRVNMEKTGIYRFDSQVRKVQYFNYLTNFARGSRYADTKRNFGDFDLTVFPERENLRLRFGGSFSRTSGNRFTTTRPFSDEFAIPSDVDLRSTDFRAGIDTKLLGFKISLTQGFRRFVDETVYSIAETNLGLDPSNNARLTSYERRYPFKGHTNWTMLNVNRTFAKKLDFTGRYIYSLTNREANTSEIFSGRDNSNNFIDNDIILSYGEAKRPQSRVDLGLTYAVTNDFRISDTFTYDTFRITGSNNLSETVFSRTSAGAAKPTTFTNSIYYRISDFERYVNTIEGDYQFNNHVGVNIGYRYTRRKIALDLFNNTLTSAPSSTNPTLEDETEENSTNSVIIGTRIKPFKNWSIFADLEHGQADNAFVRLSNYKFTNFRIRTRLNFNRFGINFSAITKDNDNPSVSTAPLATPTYPNGELISIVKSRIFTGSVDWTPNSRLNLSSGYTYQNLTSATDIVINTGSLVLGTSTYYMRDHYGFFDVSFKPVNRVTMYASYRISKDTGQGNKVQTTLNNIISSYPYTLLTPEFRMAVRLTRNIDWNVGYQYYNYKEDIAKTLPDPALWTSSTAVPVGVVAVPPPQNYKANMVYTSFRIYFGGNRER